MSDDVNEYGLGAPNTQVSEPLTHDPRTDPLAHGLGAREVDDDQHDGEDVAEGGRRNVLEHGLGGAGSRDDTTPDGGSRNPLRHGLGGQESGS